MYLSQCPAHRAYAGRWLVAGGGAQQQRVVGEALEAVGGVVGHVPDELVREPDASAVRAGHQHRVAVLRANKYQMLRFTTNHQCAKSNFCMITKQQIKISYAVETGPPWSKTGQ